MGQKINSNIFRAGTKHKDWKSKYFEKNKEEFFFYNKQDIEIRSYLEQFLKSQGLALHSFALKYTDKVLYLRVDFLIKKEAPIKMYHMYKEKRELVERLGAEKPFYFYRKFKMKKRLPLLKQYKKSSEKKKLKTYHIKNKNNFIHQILGSLSTYTGKRLHARVVFKNVGHKRNFNLNKKQKQEVKTRFFLLGRYFRARFYKESIKIFLTATTRIESSELLARFIARELEKTRRHSYFIMFLKRSFKHFTTMSFSKVKGFKIIIRGCINGKRRAKKRIIVAGVAPIQSIKSKISYSEATAFTHNGTLGVKVWLCEK